jgi:DNA-binding SARP family transcriptional activator
VAELAAYLSLHSDRPRNAEELRDPLSVGRAKPLSADTIRTYANTLRRVLGTDRVPDAARRGYTLAGCTTDWQRFLDYRAAARPDAPPAEAAQALASCLSLVRGRPFSDLPVSGYGWVATDLLISQAEVAILDAAQRLADLAMAEGDWDLAAWAAERGLIVDPTSEDLNASVIRAAASTGRTDRLSQVWRDVVRRYRAADEDVPAHISEINSQLKQALHPAPMSSPRPSPSRTSR